MDESGSCESRRSTFLRTSCPTAGDILSSPSIKLLLSRWRDYSPQVPDERALETGFVLARELNHLVRRRNPRFYQSVMFPMFRRNSVRRPVHAERSILQRGWTAKTRRGDIPQTGNDTFTRSWYKSFGREASQSASLNRLTVRGSLPPSPSLARRGRISRVIDPLGIRESRTLVYGACRAGRTGRAPSERQLNTDAMQPDQGRRSFDWLGIGRLPLYWSLRNGVSGW